MARRSCGPGAISRGSLAHRLPTQHQELISWVGEIAELTQPDQVVWCDGSEAEYDRLCEELVAKGTFTKLDPIKRPNSYYAASDPTDVARVEDRTFICSEKEEDAGPTNNWKDPGRDAGHLHRREQGVFRGSMRGRTMYVVPVLHGPARLAALRDRRRDHRLRLRRRLHADHDPHGPGRARRARRRTASSCQAVHTARRPARPTARPTCRGRATPPSTSPLPRDPRDLVLRLRLRRQRAARQEVLRAAHRLRHGARRGLARRAHADPQADPAAAARPSTSPPPSRRACGKTNLAMLEPTIPGWKVETIGDDIAWMRFGDDGRLYAINPEAGFFGVAPGTGEHTNANAMKTLCGQHHLHQRRAHRRRRRVVGGHDRGAAGAPHRLEGQRLDARRRGRPAAHPNARFTVPAAQCPIIAPEWEDPKGVPISAILFGGRRATAVPLVTESFDWQHGVFLGANVASEKTAAAEGKVGELRRDPFAMLPFCGYNMGDYFAHWLEIGARTPTPAKLPKIYYVNWFRKDDDGKFVWPGFGENSRVLKWIVERLDGKAEGVETPIGVLPTQGRARHRGPRTSPTPTWTCCSRSTRRSGARRRRWSPSTSTPSATTRRRSCGTSTTRWSSAWADASTLRLGSRICPLVGNRCTFARPEAGRSGGHSGRSRASGSGAPLGACPVVWVLPAQPALPNSSSRAPGVPRSRRPGEQTACAAWVPAARGPSASSSAGLRRELSAAACAAGVPSSVRRPPYRRGRWRRPARYPRGCGRAGGGRRYARRRPAGPRARRAIGASPPERRPAWAASSTAAASSARRGQRPQLVGHGQQRGQMPGEPDVQLFLAGAVREVRPGASAMVWTDLVRIGSYMDGLLCVRRPS